MHTTLEIDINANDKIIKDFLQFVGKKILGAHKMPAITIEIPEEILENYHTIEAIRQAIYEDVIANEYQKGNISIRQGAKMLGLTYEKFMVDFLGNRKISFINATSSELEAEFQQEDAWLDEVLGNKT